MLLSAHHLHTAQDIDRRRVLRMVKQRPRSHQRQRQPRRGRASTPTPLDIVKQPTTNDTKRQHAKKRRAKEQQKRRSQAIAAAAQRARRQRWATIAQETRDIVLGDGQYVEERPALTVDPSATHLPDGQGPSTVKVAHDIASAVTLSNQRTVLYPHYSPDLAKWQDAHPLAPSPSTEVTFVDGSTLNVARAIVHLRSEDPLRSTDVGVLSFSSPKRPGGGYLHGSSEQEDSIARASSLVASLSSPAASDFYKEHRTFKNEDGSGLHDHSIVYSAGVVVFRKDADDDIDISSGHPVTTHRDPVGGSFIPPFTINVVSAVPVNAMAVRRKHIILPHEEKVFADGIRHAMKERMARALRAFEAHGDKALVLGAFGCGSSENDVDMVAGVWAELLVCGDTVDDVKREARFGSSFDKVVFAVPKRLCAPFKVAFQRRLDEEALTVATLDN